MQSIQRVASLWVSSPLKPCRWTPFPFAPQAGYAKLGALFRAAHVTLGDHVDFVDRLGVVPDTVESPVFLAVDIIRPYMTLPTTHRASYYTYIPQVFPIRKVQFQLTPQASSSLILPYNNSSGFQTAIAL